MTLRPFARPRLWLGVWVFGWALCITLSLLPPMAMDGPPDSDKVGHFLAYFILSAWAVSIFRTRRAQACAAVALVLLGLGIEWGQANLTTTRHGDLRDAVANTLGIGLGFALGFTPLAQLLERIDRKLFGLNPPL